MNTSSSSGDDDPLREARAFNQSIYLMAGMPYFLFGTIGFMVYWGFRTAQKNAQARLRDMAPDELDAPIEDRTWPPSSPEATTE
jgi:hypothetical protein